MRPSGERKPRRRRTVSRSETHKSFVRFHRPTVVTPMTRSGGNTGYRYTSVEGLRAFFNRKPRACKYIRPGRSEKTVAVIRSNDFERLGRVINDFSTRYGVSTRPNFIVQRDSSPPCSPVTFEKFANGFDFECRTSISSDVSIRATVSRRDATDSFFEDRSSFLRITRVRDERSLPVF